MEKNTKKSIVRIIYAFAMFNLFVMCCSLMTNATTINPLYDSLRKTDFFMIAGGSIYLFVIIIPIFICFIAKFFTKSNAVNIIERFFLLIVIISCIVLLIIEGIQAAKSYNYLDPSSFNLLTAQQGVLTNVLAVSIVTFVSSIGNSALS